MAAQLLPYQEEGVKFLLDRPAELNRKPHRLLADEQGLGKTAQAIVALIRCKSKSTLIVCPAQVKYKWARDLVEWGFCSENDIYVVEGFNDTIPSAPVIIVNYDLLPSNYVFKQLKSRKYNVAVVDEAHKLKTLDSIRTKRALSATGILKQAFRKFLLSGTPIPNRPVEFFPILKTLAPETIFPHTTIAMYGQRFCNGFMESMGGWNFKGASNIPELRKRLKPFMLRREVKDVYDQLPPVTINIDYLEIDILTHPEVFELMQEVDEITPENIEGFVYPSTLRRLVAEAKAEPAICFIKNLMTRHERLVIFAYHKKLIADLCEGLKEFNPVKIAGGLTAKQKQSAVDAFVNDPDRRLFIAQVVSGGEAIDGLQKVCSYAVFVELDWSTGVMDQAISRLQRIGQERPVFAHYLIANQTIETVIATVLERKRSVIRQLISTKGVSKMTIEAKLDRIIELLEGQPTTGSVGSTSATEKEVKTSTKKSAGKSDKKKASTVVFTDVQDALQSFVKNNKSVSDIKEQARAIIKEVGGAKNMEDLEKYPEAWEAVIAECAKGPVDNDPADDEDDDFE